MVQNAKTQRIVLKIVAQSDGTYVMKSCVDSWKTLPYKWASRPAAEADFATVINKLVEAGFTVVEPEKGEKAVI